MNVWTLLHWNYVCNVYIDSWAQIANGEKTIFSLIGKNPYQHKGDDWRASWALKYWNMIPNEALYMLEGNWNLINVNNRDEDLKYIIVGQQLSDEEVEGIK